MNAIDPTAKLGENTHVWHYTVILQNVVIGDECSIGSHCEIGRGSKIGNRTRIGKGVFLPPNSVVGHGVFIGPGAIFCDDRYPRVGNSAYTAEPPTIEDDAAIGAGVKVLPGVTIGTGSMIGTGTVVTKDVPPFTVLRGQTANVYTSIFSKKPPVSDTYGQCGIFSKAWWWLCASLRWLAGLLDAAY